MFCPNCGKPIQGTDKFCMSCGHALKDRGPVQEADAEEKVLKGAEPAHSLPPPQAQAESAPPKSSQGFVVSDELLKGVGKRKLKPLYVALLVIALIGALAAAVLPEYAGGKKNPTAWPGLMFWIGCLTAYLGYVRGKSAWQYFFLGGLGGFFLSVLLIAGISRLTHGASTAETDLLKLPVYQALRDADPKAYGAILSQLQEGMRKAESREQLVLRAQPIIAASTLKFIPFASNESLISYYRMFIGNAEIIFKSSPELCYDVSLTKKKRLPPDLISDERRGQELTALAALIRSGAAFTSVQANVDPEPVLERVFRRIKEKYGSDLENFRDPLAPGVNKGKACEEAIMFYNEIFRLPPHEAGSVIRSMIASQ